MLIFNVTFEFSGTRTVAIEAPEEEDVYDLWDAFIDDLPDEAGDSFTITDVSMASISRADLLEGLAARKKAK